MSGSTVSTKHLSLFRKLKKKLELWFSLYLSSQSKTWKHEKYGFVKADSKIFDSTTFFIRMAGPSQKLLIAS
jgi:hypothetical protein